MNYELIWTGYKACGWYKEIEGKWKGKCESPARCDYCDNCPYDPTKPIKAY